MLDAVLAVIERDGVEALTMRRIAAELDASPMALYRHVPDKDQPLVALLDRLAPRRADRLLPSDPAARVLAVCRLMRDGVGEVSGTRVTGRPASGQPGLPLSVWVDEVAASIEAVLAHGGEMVRPIGAGAPEIAARFRDPAGNVVGLYQEPAQ